MKCQLEWKALLELLGAWLLPVIHTNVQGANKNLKVYFC